MIKTVIISALCLIYLTGCSNPKAGLDGIYTKVGSKILLKIKGINDSLYYFQLKDYDSSNDDYKSRVIVGTFIYSKQKARLFNADCYPFYFFSLEKVNDQLLNIGASQFKMYETFKDIKGDYGETSDSFTVNYQELLIDTTSRNISNAKLHYETLLYEFPTTRAKSEKINFNAGEKIYVVTTVGETGDDIKVDEFPNEVGRFSLIDIPRIKKRLWIITDQLEKNFK